MDYHFIMRASVQTIIKFNCKFTYLSKYADGSYLVMVTSDTPFQKDNIINFLEQNKDDKSLLIEFEDTDDLIHYYYVNNSAVYQGMSIMRSSSEDAKKAQRDAIMSVDMQLTLQEVEFG